MAFPFAILGAAAAAAKSMAAAGAASHLVPLLGGAANAGIGLLSQSSANEARKRESELAYQRQREAIREQNAYNSASAQMARLQAAGLNPNLMYDNGQQAAAGMQENIPEYTPANYESGAAPAGPVGTEIINSLIGLKDLQNKTSMTESEIALNSVKGLNTIANTLNTEADTEQKRETTKLIVQEWGFNEQFNPLKIMHERTMINLDRMRSSMISSEIRKNAYFVRNLSSQTGLNLAQTEKILGLWMYERDNILSEIRNREYQNMNLAGQAQLAFTNSEYLRGMLWVNTARYYLDKTLGFENLNLNKDKVELMRQMVELSQEKWKIEKRQRNFDFWVGDIQGTMSRFSNDMVNVGTGLINLLESPLMGNVLHPSAPIGFR